MDFGTGAEPEVRRSLREEFFRRRGVTARLGELGKDVAEVGPRLDLIRFASGGEAEQHGCGAANPSVAPGQPVLAGDENVNRVAEMSRRRSAIEHSD